MEHLQYDFSDWFLKARWQLILKSDKSEWIIKRRISVSELGAYYGRFYFACQFHSIRKLQGIILAN